jgi:nucleotidyltransferase substrate binding protein (TIGR01987 family)
MSDGTRWQQRFLSYQRALIQLSDAVALSEERALSDLEKHGLIQAFEYTHELAWKCLKDSLVAQGTQDIFGSRDTTCKALEIGLITEGETWLAMIASRNNASDSYKIVITDEIVQDICQRYLAQFHQLQAHLATLDTELTHNKDC